MKKRKIKQKYLISGILAIICIVIGAVARNKIVEINHEKEEQQLACINILSREIERATQDSLCILFEEGRNGISIIPEYYEEHVETKVNQINTYREKNLSQFIFITDMHINVYNYTFKSTNIINRICRETGISRLFNGGDLFNGGTGKTKREAMDLFRKGLENATPTYFCEKYFVMGNHDNGIDWPAPGEETPPALSPDEMYLILDEYHAGNDMVEDVNCKANYYVDDKYAKIRYIVLSTGVSYVAGSNDNNTLCFLADTLLELPSDYSVVVFQHVIANQDSGLVDAGKWVVEVLDAYVLRECINLGDKTYDYKDSLGSIIALIGGHAHCDMDLISDSGFPIIITTSDNCGAEKATNIRQPETISEQAFDVFSIDCDNRIIYVTRIGYGNDRRYEY